MRDFAVLGTTVLYACVMVWAYFNRASEKVVTTLFLGLAALIASLIAVTFFSSEGSLRKSFATPIFLDGKSLLPLEVPSLSALPIGLASQASEKLKAHPELMSEEEKKSFAQTLYHHLLQRAIIFWLEKKYPNTWQVDETPMGLGEQAGYFFQSKAVPSEFLNPDQLRAKMGSNRFSDLYGPFGTSKVVGLALPKSTTLEITAPHHDSAWGEVSKITLHNHFSTITIETRASMFTVGAGSYYMALGLTPEKAQETLKTDEYTVIVSATFSRFLSGNPEMAAYKTWASDIVDGLQRQFDEQAIWSKTKEWLIFDRLMEKASEKPKAL